MHSSEESLTAEVIGEDIQVDLVLSWLVFPTAHVQLVALAPTRALAQKLASTEYYRTKTNTS